MKTKNGFVLRQLADEYILSAEGLEQVDFTHLISLNDTAAYLWQQVEGKEFTEELPEFEYRLRVKAGLTGYAQIAGKYNTTPKDKLIMDMMYIEQFSILRDIQIIFQTVIVLLKSDSTEGFGKAKESGLKFVPYTEKGTDKPSTNNTDKR